MIKKHLLFTFSFLIIFFSNLSVAAVSGQGGGQFHEGYFGIIEINNDGEAEFVVTDRVPLIEGQFYGWVIKVGPQLSKVKWKDLPVSCRRRVEVHGLQRRRPAFFDNRVFQRQRRAPIVGDSTATSKENARRGIGGNRTVATSHRIV